MTVTRDVILDLLPLYLADEASADTRALVETYLATDPQMARLAQQVEKQPLAAEVPAPNFKEHELQTLQKTKFALRIKSALLAFALFFSLLPLSFRIDDGRLHWLFADNLGLVVVIAAVAVAAWLGYFLFWARLRQFG